VLQLLTQEVSMAEKKVDDLEQDFRAAEQKVGATA
jgi:hypothetical protein